MYFNAMYLNLHKLKKYIIHIDHLRGPMTLVSIFRAFGSEAVTTCFYDFGLSQLGFGNLTFHLRGERSNRLNHRRGQFCIRENFTCMLIPNILTDDHCIVFNIQILVSNAKGKVCVGYRQLMKKEMIQEIKIK